MMEKMREVEMPGMVRTLMNAMGYANAKAFVEDTAEEFLDDLPFSEPPPDWEDDLDGEYDPRQDCELANRIGCEECAKFSTCWGGISNE